MLTAALGSEPSCLLTDVSVSGFSLVSGTHHRIGKQLDVTLRYEDDEFNGSARVQSIKVLPSGQNRYGMSPVGRSSGLERGQKRISMEVQRQQLQRRKNG